MAASEAEAEGVLTALASRYDSNGEALESAEAGW